MAAATPEEKERWVAALAAATRRIALTGHPRCDEFHAKTVPAEAARIKKEENDAKKAKAAKLKAEKAEKAKIAKAESDKRKAAEAKAKAEKKAAADKVKAEAAKAKADAAKAKEAAKPDASAKV